MFGQTLDDKRQQQQQLHNNSLIIGCDNATSSKSNIPNINKPTFKIGRISAEEKKEKIKKYKEKKNQRNFSKKIKVQLSLNELFVMIHDHL